MAMSSCPGPVMDMDCGVWECRLDCAHEPREDESWDECCERCQGGHDQDLELTGDCERDAICASA